MNNTCSFSPCRTHRYVLHHRWDELFFNPHKIAWIGLNPSTADENQLDPTLRRIKGFSRSWGFTQFFMLNLFAFRATLPSDLKKFAAGQDPVGPENDAHCLKVSRECEVLVAAWGTHGTLKRRNESFYRLLEDQGQAHKLKCLHLTQDGHPSHPLYLPQTCQLLDYRL